MRGCSVRNPRVFAFAVAFAFVSAFVYAFPIVLLVFHAAHILLALWTLLKEENRKSLNRPFVSSWTSKGLVPLVSLINSCLRSVLALPEVLKKFISCISGKRERKEEESGGWEIQTKACCGYKCRFVASSCFHCNIIAPLGKLEKWLIIINFPFFVNANSANCLWFTCFPALSICYLFSSVSLSLLTCYFASLPLNTFYSS